MSGQRVSDAGALIHRNIGTDKNLFSLFSDSGFDNSPFHLLNYSDDFGSCEPAQERAQLSFKIFGLLLKSLGLSESEDKAESPRQIMSFLGVEFDTVKLELRVNLEKCTELKSELNHWIRRTVATKAELQSILGKLLWVSKAVHYSRVFVSRIINEIKTLTTQKQKLTLSSEVRKDFIWWHEYMSIFNGVHFLIENCVSVQLAGDACPQGMGCYNPSINCYFSTKFPTYLQDPSLPIHLKEFMCVIISTKKWGHLWVGKQIQFFCDNDSVADAITFMKPKDGLMQSYLREFLYLVCKFNFSPIVSKINTKENDIADFLSRNYCQKMILKSSFQD